jgi:iron transport multicopper oxidase
MTRRRLSRSPTGTVSRVLSTPRSTSLSVVFPLSTAPTDYVQASTLINGLGRTWDNTTSTPLSVTNVTHGRRYRLRLLSFACEPAYTFSIDQHNLTIIEADGQLHKPYIVDSVTIHAGQRYSAILHATQPIGNYWIRALPVGDGLNSSFVGGINSAILRYSGAPDAEPNSINTANANELVEAKLVPYTHFPEAPGGHTPDAPDVHAINMEWTLNSNFQFELNGTVRTLPSVPTLLQILSGKPAQDVLPAGQYIPLPRDRVIQLSFPGGDTFPTTRHPMHLHGHSFYVVRSAGQDGYNFKNPPRRDVVNMGGAGDNVTIRFVTDNPGEIVDFLRCLTHHLT